MKKYLPFSRRQPSLDRFAITRGGWGGSDRFGGKSLRRTSAASLNTRTIQVVRGAYNIDLNKVDSSFTKLHKACLLNDDIQVKKHLQKVDNNARDSSNRYPIHLATVNGNNAILKLLIENGAKPNVQDNEGNTPLIKSIECGHEHLVKYLLCNGADPNISDFDNNTALHWAIMTESIIAIDALLSSKKCDFSLRNYKDETCLHLAVRSPLINTHTFETLLRGGSDLNLKDQLGLTALEIAQSCSNRIALNVFNRFIGLEKAEQVANKEIKSVKIENPKETSQNNQVPSKTSDRDRQGSGAIKQFICDGYKQKLLTKNKENLQYEKRLIQMNAEIERLKIDVESADEQNERMRLNCERLIEENKHLQEENERLRQQLNSRNHQTSKQHNADSYSLNSSLNNPNCSLKSNDELNCLDSSIDQTDCQGQREFLIATSLNQRRINQLKSSLAAFHI